MPQQTKLLPSGAETYSDAMSDARNYINWILASFENFLQPNILEIGVGHGSYAQELKKLGPYVGIDIDEHSVAEARAQLPDLEFHVADITAQDFADRFADKNVGSIVCLNVLEHVPDDETAVLNLAAALRAGGYLLVIVPAFQTLYNDLDKHAGHLRRYKCSEVGSLFGKANLTPIRCEYFNPIGGLGWWANGLVRHGSLNDPAVNSQISIFDKYVLPLSRLCNPLTKSVFGQSVLAIGRKE